MTTLRFKTDCEIQAAARDKKPATIRILAYSGDVMSVPNWGATVISLSGLELGDSIPLLLDHQNTIDQLAGSGSPRIENGSLIIEGRLARGTSSADKLINLAQAGISLQASVGVEVLEVERIKNGETLRANGREFVASRDGIAHTTRGRLREVSLVAMGADSETTVAIAARGSTMKTSPDFITWAESIGCDTKMMTAEQLASLHANSEGRSTPTDADREATLPFIAASADPVAQETRRITQIEAACSGEWDGDFSHRVSDIKAQAIAGELSVDETIQAMRPIRVEKMHSTYPKHRTIYSRQDNQSEVIEAAFCMSGGLSNIERYFDEPTLDAAAKHYRNMSMHQMIMMGAVSNGYPAIPGERPTQGNLRSLLDYSFRPIHASGFSTMSLPNTFSNVANKFMREGFDSVDQVALRISNIKSVRDFKATTTISLTGGLDYEEVGPGGEIKHGTLGEEVYTNQAVTYGRMLAITRQNLINDDSDVLSAVPRRLGRGGMLKLSEAPPA